MSADLDTLLRDAAGAPSPLPDVEELWDTGRRRRRVRHLGAGASSLAAVAAVALVLGNVVGGTAVVTPIEPADPVPTEQQDEEPVDERPVERETPDDGEVIEPIPPVDGHEVPELAPPSSDATDGVDDQPAGDAEDVQEGAADVDPAPQDAPTSSGADVQAPPATPTPDAARLADPCAVHRGGDPRVFIDVVGPVDAQVVDGALQLVGCATVYEGTVLYRVVADGGVVVQGLTTASAGGPELGEFRETITVPGSGPATLEVFWEDAEDGSERDVQRIAFVRG
jgi:hypothetical protein